MYVLYCIHMLCERNMYSNTNIVPIPNPPSLSPQKCTVEVFVEQLWVPALKAGVIDQVQDILKALDHSLGQWEPYLTGVCQFFSQRSLYHVLYQTQLYMRVRVCVLCGSVCVCACMCACV